jgi:TPR repeat protein
MSHHDKHVKHVLLFIPYVCAKQHDMAMSHVQRRGAVGRGLKVLIAERLAIAKLLVPPQDGCRSAIRSRLLQQLPPLQDSRPRHQIDLRSVMLRVVRTGFGSSVCCRNALACRLEAAHEASMQCELGRYAEALPHLRNAIKWGHLPSRALLAWLTCSGRSCIRRDTQLGGGLFALVVSGATLGCPDCQGVLSFCFRLGYGCPVSPNRSKFYASLSASAGSRYGLFVLGCWTQDADIANGFACSALALHYFDRASRQYLDIAQYERLFRIRDANMYADAIKHAFWLLSDLAVRCGYPPAVFRIGCAYVDGSFSPHVVHNPFFSMMWLCRALEAGDPDIAHEAAKILALFDRGFFSTPPAA